MWAEVLGSLVGNFCRPTDLETSMGAHASGGGPPRSALFGHGSWSEALRISDVYVGRRLVGRCCSRRRSWRWCGPTHHGPALCEAVRDTRLGPASLHLDLTVGQWAADGLLAIFFVAGLELKREFVAGDLRDPRQAALPVAAALGGMVVPAALFVLINQNTGGGALQGWAIPVATDIAFALAVLAVISSHCRRRCVPSCSAWPWSTTCWRSPSLRCSSPPTCT